MKTVVSLLVVVSFALNIFFVGALFTRREPPASPSARPDERPAVAAPSGPVVNGQVWAQLKSAEGLPAMVKRLRDAGFPPDLVRVIMAAQLRESYAARLRALDPGAESRPFWKGVTADPRVMQAQNALYREQRKLLRELLGPDAEPAENVNAIFQGRRMDSVPADKVDDVRRLLRELEEARSDAYSGSTGGLISTDLAKKLRDLDKAHQDALGQVLSPAELEAYNLRNSDTARQLRGNLAAFDPMEQEFKTLFKLQAEFDARYSNLYGVSSPDEQRQRMEAQRQLTEQMKAALGPVRGEEYERASDYSYRQTSQLVARLELPSETTARVWEVKKDIEQRSMSLYRDQSLAADERRTRLAALAEESTTRLSPLLGGTRGLEAYKLNGGFWLNNLTPRPAQPVTTGGVIQLVPR